MSENNKLTKVNKPLTIQKSKSILDPFLSRWSFWPTDVFGVFDDLFKDVGHLYQEFVTVGGDDSTINIELNLPGFTKEEVKVSIEDNTLHVSAKNDKKSAYYSTTLSKKVIADSADVKLENGVLKITFQRSPESKPKILEIK